MTVSDEINKFISENGGNERDALNVALARIKALEAQTTTYVCLECEGSVYPCDCEASEYVELDSDEARQPIPCPCGCDLSFTIEDLDSDTDEDSDPNEFNEDFTTCKECSTKERCKVFGCLVDDERWRRFEDNVFR